MRYLIEHTILLWCWWDVLALVILAGICVYAVIRIKKMKKLEKQLEERLAGDDAVSAVTTETETTV